MQIVIPNWGYNTARKYIARIREKMEELHYYVPSGKTKVALMSIKLLKKHLPNIRCIIVVPTETLKEQWEQHLTENDLIFNCEVHIINSLIKNKWKCDLLVIDK